MESIVIPTGFVPPNECPFPAPFILSSMERAWCMHDPAKIVFIKRSHLEKNLESMGLEMDGEQKKFLDYWCSPQTIDPATIRAELDPCFNLKQRAENWMERARPEKPQPKSRLEKYAESARQFIEASQAVSASASVTRSRGYADIPDEQ